jgi:hypothetical protein
MCASWIVAPASADGRLLHAVRSHTRRSLPRASRPAPFSAVLAELEKIKKERAAECEKRLAAAKKSVAERKAARDKAAAVQKSKYEGALKKYRHTLERMRDAALKADKERDEVLKAEEALAEMATEYAALLAHKFASERNKDSPKLTKKEDTTFKALEARIAACRHLVETRVKADTEQARVDAVNAAFASTAAAGSSAKAALAAADVDIAMLDSIGATNAEASNKLSWMMFGVLGAAARRLPRPRMSGIRTALCGPSAEMDEATGAVRSAGILELPPGVLLVTDSRVIAMNADVANNEKVAGAPLFAPDSVQLRLLEREMCPCTCFANCCVYNRIHKYQLTATWGADDTPEYIDMRDIVGPVVRKASTVAQMQALVSSDATLAGGNENHHNGEFGGFPKYSCFAKLCCLCHKDWSVSVDKTPTMLVNRSIAFQVRRLPTCDMVPEEMRGMWAHVRVHFKSAMTVDQLNAVMTAFGAEAGSAIREGAIPLLPTKPEVPALPALLGLDPLMPLSTMRLVMHDEDEADESSKKSGKKSSDDCCGQPINVAICIGGNGNDDKQAVTVKSKAKEHTEDLSA